MTRNLVEYSIIHHHNWPWSVIDKQTTFFLLLRKFAVWQGLIIISWLAPTLCNFISLCPYAFFCVLYLKNEEEKSKNKAFLPSEKEESQTLANALILSSDTYNEYNYLSLHHRIIQDCK